jgi:monofunctional biosynthetic peptidoglycan transglycosylase
MSEDASFYSHPGVDFYEMKESVKTDLSRGQFARGASTITQQLAKNVFLSNSKNILRKLEEIYLAFQIEKYFSKFNIITLYLNVVEFGDGIYGVKAACHHYFDKEPGDVTPEESAFLAFLLPNPKKYSQSYKRHQLTPFAEKTIRTILHKMLKGHKITDEEHDLAVARMPQFPWGKTFESGSPDEVPIEMGGAGETTTPGQSMGEIPQETPSDEDNFNFDFTTEEKQ